MRDEKSLRRSPLLADPPAHLLDLGRVLQGLRSIPEHQAITSDPAIAPNMGHTHSRIRESGSFDFMVK